MLIPWRVVDFTAVSSKTTSGCGEICRQHLVAWLQSTPKVSNGTGVRESFRKMDSEIKFGMFIYVYYMCVYILLYYT